MKGSALNYLGKYDEAIECAERALGEYDKAIECAEKAADVQALKERAADVLALKGEALSYKGVYKGAIVFAEKAIEEDKDRTNAYARFVKGYAIDYSGYHDKAIEYYDEAIAIDSDDTDALNGMGIALNYKNRYNEAEKRFNEAIILLSKKGGKYQDIAYSYLNKSV